MFFRPERALISKHFNKTVFSQLFPSPDGYGEDAKNGKKQAAVTFFDIFLHDTMESRIKRVVRIYTAF
jgi:hypothetical protein